MRVEAENLKNQEEAERLDREATEDALRQMAELDAQLQVQYNAVLSKHQTSLKRMFSLVLIVPAFSNGLERIEVQRQSFENHLVKFLREGSYP